LYNVDPVLMKAALFLLFGVLAIGLVYLQTDQFRNFEIVSGAPPYDASSSDFVTDSEERALLQNWTRPEGPAKVALQVGHWKNDEVPEELHRLRGNTGASGGGKTEWEVNYDIAVRAKTLLEEQGVTVELLPATVPPQYWADVFVSIHADGSLDPNKTGYKLATPRRDYTDKADDLLAAIETSYGQATGLELDPNVTRNMRGYYAFSWWRYDHAVHPMTASVILETGFLSSPADQELLIGDPQKSAEGLAEGVIQYLQAEKLLNS
jgi:hypothetical protein